MFSHCSAGSIGWYCSVHWSVLVLSLPAILDLWLLDDRPLTALLVFLLFLFPSFVIDPLINSEIKG